MFYLFFMLRVVAEFKLDQYVNDGKVYFAVVKAIYGLPRAGFLAQERLIKHLEEAGYVLDKRVPFLFKYDKLNVIFGVKYKDQADAEHLVAALSKHCKLKVDWDCHTYLGVEVNWDRVQGKVSLSMP